MEMNKVCKKKVLHLGYVYGKLAGWTGLLEAFWFVLCHQLRILVPSRGLMSVGYCLETVLLLANSLRVYSETMV